MEKGRKWLEKKTKKKNPRPGHTRVQWMLSRFHAEPSGKQRGGIALDERDQVFGGKAYSSSKHYLPLLACFASLHPTRLPFPNEKERNGRR